MGMFCRKNRIVRAAVIALVLLAAVAAALLLYNKESSAPPKTPPSPEESGESAEREVLFTVVVDAGHGGRDGGASGKSTGVVESALNLSVAMLVRDIFEENGARVIMTREDENAIAPTKRADMAERKRIMNLSGVDIVVSVHMNKFRDSSANGPMTFYMKGSKDGERLAKCVIDAICAKLTRDKRPANPGDYFVIRESPVPSVLVECGFLSNPEDEILLQDEAHQRKLAEGIVAGVMEYLGYLGE